MRDVDGRPPPTGGHCMVRFDSHRAVMYGGTSGRAISNLLHVVDLARRVCVWEWLCGSGCVGVCMCMHGVCSEHS